MGIKQSVFQGKTELEEAWQWVYRDIYQVKTLTQHTFVNMESPDFKVTIGGFNVPVNKPMELDPALFLDVLYSFNLNNRVNFPTHRDGNILDLIMHDTGLNIIMKPAEVGCFQIKIQSLI